MVCGIQLYSYPFITLFTIPYILVQKGLKTDPKICSFIFEYGYSAKMDSLSDLSNSILKRLWCMFIWCHKNNTTSSISGNGNLSWIVHQLFSWSGSVILSYTLTILFWSVHTSLYHYCWDSEQNLCYFQIWMVILLLNHNIFVWIHMVTFRINL